MINLEGAYGIGRVVIAVLIFIVSWIYIVVKFGILGLLFGWIEALIIAAAVGF